MDLGGFSEATVSTHLCVKTNTISPMRIEPIKQAQIALKLQMRQV